MISSKLPLKKILLGTLAAGTATAGGVYAYHKLRPDSEYSKIEDLPSSPLKPRIEAKIPVDANGLAPQKFELTIELEIFPIEHQEAPAATEASQANTTNWLGRLFPPEDKESNGEIVRGAEKNDFQEQVDTGKGAVSSIINWIGAIKEDNPFWSEHPKTDIPDKTESEAEHQSYTTNNFGGDKDSAGQKDNTQDNAEDEDTEEKDEDNLVQKVVFADVVEKDTKKCECAEIARQGEVEAKMEPSTKPKSFSSNTWLSGLFTQEDVTEKSNENKDLRKCDFCVETAKQSEIDPKSEPKGELQMESGTHAQSNPGSALGGGLSQEDKNKQGALTAFNIKESGEGKAKWIGGYGLRAIILSTILAAPKKPANPARVLSNLPPPKKEQ